jgi:hypothetical protein
MVGRPTDDVTEVSNYVDGLSIAITQHDLEQAFTNRNIKNIRDSIWHDMQYEVLEPLTRDLLFLAGADVAVP